MSAMLQRMRAALAVEPASLGQIGPMLSSRRWFISLRATYDTAEGNPIATSAKPGRQNATYRRH
jgi:hypothetical protein